MSADRVDNAEADEDGGGGDGRDGIATYEGHNMKQNSFVDMKQSYMDKQQVISDFLEVNAIDKSRQVTEFKAIVEYVEYSIQDVTKVQMKLDNFYWGDIEVFETDKIDLRVVHTGFSVRFNYYQLDNQTLIIRGKASPAKGGKNYTVRITPVVI